MLKSDYYQFVTEAFRYVFSKIPPDFDCPLLRRSIAEAMSSAEVSNATVADVRNAGLTVLSRILLQRGAADEPIERGLFSPTIGALDLDAGRESPRALHVLERASVR